MGHFQAIMSIDEGVPIVEYILSGIAPGESVLVTTSVSGVPIKNMTVSRHTLPSISSTSVPSPIHNETKRKEVDCEDRANLKKRMRLDQEISTQGSTLF